jgi:hypothetical protein
LATVVTAVGWTAAEIIRTSQMLKAKERPATGGIKATVEMPVTVL